MTTVTLYWSQRYQHRVLRIRAPLSANPIVDVVLGQTDLANTYCNRNPADPANANPYAAPDPDFVMLNTLCYPGALSIDKQGNLYVSDHYHEISGNQRLLMFSSATFSTSPSSVVFAPDATKVFPRSEGFATWEPAFDSTNRMVVGYNPYSLKSGRFVEYFDHPTSASTIPSGKLNDYYGWAVAATFDAADNLYVFDANRAKVLKYNRPFNNPTPLGVFDVDGNGQVDALTDGVMIVRYLFGLRGASLIAGAVGTGATRTTATQIETYIQSLMP